MLARREYLSSREQASQLTGANLKNQLSIISAIDRFVVLHMKREMDSKGANTRTPSTEDSAAYNEDNFVEALISQVDEENIEDIIRCQKKSWVLRLYAR